MILTKMSEMNHQFDRKNRKEVYYRDAHFM